MKKLAPSTIKTKAYRFLRWRRAHGGRVADRRRVVDSYDGIRNSDVEVHEGRAEVDIAFRAIERGLRFGAGCSKARAALFR